MSLNKREIHPTHRTGILHAIARALALPPDSPLPRQFLLELVETGVTYGELNKIKETTIKEALQDVLARAEVKIARSRADYVVELFPRIRPELRACRQCGALDLHLDAGEWNAVTQGDCAACGSGTYVEVGFTQGPRAWTTRKVLPVGATHDELRYPATDAALEELYQERKTRVDPALREALTAVDTGRVLALTDVAEYLAHRDRNPLDYDTVLRALCDAHLFAVDRVALELELQKALAYRGVSMVASDRDGREQAVPTGGGGVLPPPSPPAPSYGAEGSNPLEPRLFMKAFREALCQVYRTHEQIREVLTLARINLDRVSFQGALGSVWFNALQEAEASEKYSNLFRCVLGEHQDVFGPLVPAFIDVDRMARVFYGLSDAKARELGQRLGMPAWSLERNSAITLLRSIRQNYSLVDLYKLMVSDNLL